MHFKSFITEAEVPDHLRHWSKKEKYVPRFGWWKTEQGCIEHLEKTNHNVQVQSDGTIKIPGDLNLIDLNIPSLAIRFSRVEGHAKLQGNRLMNFDWAKDLVVLGTLDLTDNDFVSLLGIEKHLKKAKKLVLRGNKIRESILGLMLVRVQDLDVGYSWRSDSGTYYNNDLDFLGKDAERAFRIIKQHRVPTIIDMDRVIDAQHELIEAGLEEYAKLA